MSEPLERAQQLFAAFEAELKGELPAGVEVFDAHTHLGTDIDGMVGRPEELAAIFDRYGISRCFMFCLDEPDRHPGFRAGNDRTLVFAAGSAGRFIPFVRLDLSESPIEEAERCLDLGARGIKLHPRAQKFVLDDQRLAPVFAIASERRVPILIHGGRGLPPIADHLHGLVDTYPEVQLINANRIADGEPPLAPSQPQGADVLHQPMTFARIHQYLSMAMPLIYTRQQDTFGALGLALNACNERDGHVEELGEIHELLVAARELWRTLPEAQDDVDARIVARTTARLIHLADIVAVTTGV